ncbi:MAG: response regulator [Butyrivibrio sp.]|uniref:PAS domain-containing hybrid sensor histidine kinase/response regulator n=1 Tax=Butyrivibrio sp. TaxID=28121 RepID=UPI001B163346|nr:PAS domain-containing hybrid sensor histidine kinase/response regulator [Butyrivibrio sp.]MBO6241561.1 response regulator [Butyrivibrio sp.]
MRTDKTKLSLESIENISERMPGGFFIYKADETEELIAYNDVVLNIYGCADRASFKKLTGGTFKGMVHPDDYKNVDSSILDQISTDEEKFDHVEYRIIKNDGSVAYVDDFGRLVDTEEFGSVYYVFIQDITEKKRIMDENFRMEKELERQRQTKIIRDEFLFNVSHDIRTPMNAIMGYTDLAIKYMDDKKELSESLSKVKESSKHMMSLIDDLLDMSEISSGEVTLREEICSIKEELTLVYDIMYLRAKEKDITLEMNVDVPDDTVLIDAHRLRRIISNLVDNAIKFSNKEARVIVSAMAGKPSASGYSRYEFIVSDTGIGMSEEFLQNLFTPFSRENSSTVSGIRGAGLGLSITKKLVDIMGGTINCQSKKGEGTTFIVSLPLKAAKGSKKPEISKDAPAKAEGTYRLLLVEDMKINRLMAEKILLSTGFLVDSVEDGSDAVESVANSAENFYDLIIMDIQMPVMNGYEATRRIRSLPRKDSKSIPIIALSANVRDEDRQKSFESGMNGHIGKPFEADKLIKTINDEIGKRKK